MPAPIYKKIPFAVVKKHIEKIFNNESNSIDFVLTPGSIHQLAEQCGVQFKWRPILNWEDNTYELSNQDYLDIAFAKVTPAGGETIIVTDECFRDQEAFSVFHFKDMIYFMEIVYPDLLNMEFTQPCDYIFIQPGIDLITMIHHEGMRTKYIRV